MRALPLVSATDPESQAVLSELDRKLGAYYNGPGIVDYYRTAHSFNDRWSEQSDHWLIREEVRRGMSVLDMGCGSGHSYANLKDREVSYTGVDISGLQMDRNAATFGPGPEFHAASLYRTGLADGRFDLTFSTFVLEHLVWPHLFLREMVRVTRPGGVLIILCPHFRPRGRIPSLPYGSSVATLKQRVKSGRLLAAARHLYLRNVAYPRAIRARFPEEKFPFLINLEPTCLTGPYYSDNDAVYLTCRREVVRELAQAGVTDVTGEVLAARGRAAPRRDTLLVVARKATG